MTHSHTDTGTTGGDVVSVPTNSETLSRRPAFRFPIPDGEYVAKAPKGHVSLYGHHPKWCNESYNVSGASFHDHGPECTASLLYLRVPSFDTGDGFLSVELSKPYVNGIYRVEDGDVEGWRHQYVDHGRNVKVARYIGDENDDRPQFLTAPEARSLAAALLHAADTIEGRLR